MDKQTFKQKLVEQQLKNEISITKANVNLDNLEHHKTTLKNFKVFTRAFMAKFFSISAATLVTAGFCFGFAVPIALPICLTGIGLATLGCGALVGRDLVRINRQELQVEQSKKEIAKSRDWFKATNSYLCQKIEQVDLISKTISENDIQALAQKEERSKEENTNILLAMSKIDEEFIIR